MCGVMEFVSDKNDIIVNMNTIDQYLMSGNLDEAEYAKELIRRGHCFIADDSTGRWRFYPSRFIGYSNNSMKAHESNKDKNGLKTNPVLNSILKHKNNPNDELETAYIDYCHEIGIELSRINRSYWKLGSLDEKQRASIRQGISHRNIKAESEYIDALEHEIEGFGLEGEDRIALIKVRVNQKVFRDELLRRYKQCCLCGVQDKHLLVASHIKPWSVCEKTEKLDVDNGFLMCPDHDLLFDKGYISFTDNGEILISDSLLEHDRVFMNVNKDMRIDLTEGNKKYLKLHRSLYGF